MFIKECFDFTGQVVIITGAGGTIGNALAKGFSECGASIVAVDLNPERAQKTIDEISRNKKHLALMADVTKLKSIENMIVEVLKNFGKIDVLLNHAGINIRKPVIDYSERDWNKIVDTNLKGIFFVAQKVGRVMIEQKRGRIINTASVSSVRGHPNLSIYAATKGGVLQLTKAMAIEWAPYNIFVNAIGPGYIYTEQTNLFLRNSEVLNQIISKVPMKRLGNPQDLVGPALFLASNAASYITGQVLFVEGGRLID